jgi:hypothetical protein
MRTNNKLILLLVFFFLHIFDTQGQVYELKLDTIRNDTLNIYYLRNFNYDVIIIYINGVEVSTNILYSKREIGSARVSNSFYINYPDSTIKLDIILYERNQQFSIEYNALWYEWSIESDGALYYKPIKRSYEIVLEEDGSTNIGIFLDMDINSKSGKRKVILLERLNDRLFLD